MENDRSTIEEIKSSLDIVNTVDKYVKLKQAGKNYSGLCPFHNEKTPSFIVSPDIQRYRCFGCGKSGDIFNFVQEVETLDFVQTLEKLAKEAGVEIKKSGSYGKFAWLEWLNNFSADFYHNALMSKEGTHALKYLNDRGISNELAIKYKIGYAAKRSPLSTEIKNKAKSRLSKSQLLDTGLFKEKDGQMRDKFNDRIMFPIWNLSGKVVGFSGRQTPTNDFGPKFLNTPETPIFHKSKTLLGIYQAKNFIRKEDLAILCEGNLDVISSETVELYNVVAPMGTAITQQQLEILSRYTKNILFFFDSDDAGQKAVERGFKIAAGLKLNAYATNPDPYQDIDDMIQKAPKDVRPKVENKMDAFTYLLTNKVKQLDPSNNLQDLQTVIKYVNFLLEDVDDPTLRSFYINKANKITKIKVKDLAEAPKSYTTTSSNSSDTEAQQQVINAPPLPASERRFLELLLISPSLSKVSKIQSKYFTNSELKSIILIIQNEKIDNPKKILESEVINEIQRKYIEDGFFGKESTDSDKELNTIYKRLSNEYLEVQIRATSSQLAIAEAEQNSEEIDKLTKLSVKLSKLKQETN
jgi:DNA primase